MLKNIFDLYAWGATAGYAAGGAVFGSVISASLDAGTIALENIQTGAMIHCGIVGAIVTGGAAALSQIFSPQKRQP